MLFQQSNMPAKKSQPWAPQGPLSSNVQLDPLAAGGSSRQSEVFRDFNANNLPNPFFDHLDSRVYGNRGLFATDPTVNYNVNHPPLPGSVAQSSRASATPRRLRGIIPSDENGDTDDGDSSGLTESSEEDSALRAVEFDSSSQTAEQLGFHNSPFFPQTLAAYTEVRSRRKSWEKRRSSDEKKAIRDAEEQHKEALQFKERRERLLRDPLVCEDMNLFGEFIATPLPHQPALTVFWSHPGIAQDGRSAVLSRETCFSKPDPNSSHRDLWPSESTLKTFRGLDKLPPPPTQSQFPPQY